MRKFRDNNILGIKLLFVRYPDLLKRLVAAILSITVDSMTEFTITNPDIPARSNRG